MRVLAVLTLALFTSCRCGGGLTTTEPASLRAEPRALTFEPTWAGTTRTLPITFTNVGGASADVTLATSFPFAVERPELRLARGQTETVQVTFAPTSAGHFSALLNDLPLEGNGLAIPECSARDVCHASSFDPEAGQCSERTRDDGAACATRCITGTCQSATCVGQSLPCDDVDACTTDACSEDFGCVHAPRTCAPPSNPCEVATCDSTAGCGTKLADDGTLCGADDCLSTTVMLCLSGQCVARTRPDVARCTNRWMAQNPPARSDAALTWSPRNERTLLFGGSLTEVTAVRGDTWLWNGTQWESRLPTNSPQARASPAVATDVLRGRVVLFGGQRLGSFFADTWEWDGTTWLERFPALAPSARTSASVGYDVRRARVVLFGGFDASELDDTWEWDGTVWRELNPPHRPPARRGNPPLVWDPTRQRLVLHAGSTYPPFVAIADTWEFDGTDWVEVTAAPTARSGPALAWDGVNGGVLRFGGVSAIGPVYSATTELRGSAQWTTLTPMNAPSVRTAAAASWDPVRREVVLFGGRGHAGSSFETWAWNGTSWNEKSAAPQGRVLSMQQMGSRGIVALGTRTLTSQSVHFEWDGTRWVERALAVTPPQLQNATMVYDSVRDRLVLFGGAAAQVEQGDTWEFNGAAWSRVSTPTSPPARKWHASAFDPVRGRVVIFGGRTATTAFMNDTWEYDGTTWVEVPSVGPEERVGAAMYWDEAAQRVTLYSGFVSRPPPMNGATRDVWDWDGTSWVERVTTGAPAADLPALVYDPVRARAVVHCCSSRGTMQQTWELTGSTWTRKTPVDTPIVDPLTFSMAWDPINQRVLALEQGVTWFFLP